MWMRRKLAVRTVSHYQPKGNILHQSGSYLNFLLQISFSLRRESLFAFWIKIIDYKIIGDYFPPFHWLYLLYQSFFVFQEQSHSKIRVNKFVKVTPNSEKYCVYIYQKIWSHSFHLFLFEDKKPYISPQNVPCFTYVYLSPLKFRLPLIFAPTVVKNKGSEF